MASTFLASAGQEAAMQNQRNSFKDSIPLSSKLLMDEKETGEDKALDDFAAEELAEAAARDAAKTKDSDDKNDDDDDDYDD